MGFFALNLTSVRLGILTLMVRGTTIAVFLGLLVSSEAVAAPQFLAVGRFEEHGRGVKGHGRVLKRALRAELSQSGAFELVADDAQKRQALRRIRRDMSKLTEERQWVEVGKAVGATHLILGEVQEDRNTCLAFAQLIHLESQKTKVTLPQYYDCTRSDLVQIAGDLSMQLAGKRASTPKPRKHLVAKSKAVKIEMRDRTAVIDGKRYTFYEGEIVPESKRPKTATPPPPYEPPPVAPPPPYEPPPHDDDTTVSSYPPATVAPSIDLSRWPGLLAPDNGYTLHNLVHDVSDKRELIESVLLVVPLALLLIGAIVTRLNQTAGHFVLRTGFAISVLAASAELAALAFYRWVLDRDVMLDADPLLLGAPAAGLVIWLVGGWIFRVLKALRIARHILWTFIFTAFFLVLLLVGSQVQTPAWILAVVTVVFYAAMSTVARLRARRAAAAA